MIFTVFFNIFLYVSAQPAIIPTIVNEGQMCGGMMPVNMLSSCNENLECVYTLGPMIADAPGFCRPKCPTVRDQWGNCVPDNCEIWDDGCNTCTYDKESSSLITCTEEVCYTPTHQATCQSYSIDVNSFFHCSQSYDVLSQMNNVCCANKDLCLTGFPDRCSPECASLVNLVFNNCKTALNLDNIVGQTGWEEFHQKCLHTSGSVEDKPIPVNCAVWYDGCNTCSVVNGVVNFCSLRMCLTMGEQNCREHHVNVTTAHEANGDCFDSLDNDNDGLSDCDDPDCRIYGRCRMVNSENGRSCFDNIDNDGDGLVDCDDPECLMDPRAQRRCGGIRTPLIDEPLATGGH